MDEERFPKPKTNLNLKDNNSFKDFKKEQDMMMNNRNSILPN